jgi:hypothetical protein
MEPNYILFIVPTKQDDNTGQNNVADHASELKNEPMPLKRNCKKFYNLSSESKELEELQESSARVLESLDSRNHASVRHSLIDAITAVHESGPQKVVGKLRNIWSSILKARRAEFILKTIFPCQFLSMQAIGRLAFSNRCLKPSCRLAFSSGCFKASCRLAFSNGCVKPSSRLALSK